MKALKMFGLAVLAALMGTAFVGASSAMALHTAICNVNVALCESAHIVTHLHETTLSGAKAKLLDGSGNTFTECDVLFLGDALTTKQPNGTFLALSNPLVIHGHFTYINCTNGCSAAEVSGTDSLLELLRTGTDEGRTTGEGEVALKCIFFTCTYNGEGLEKTNKGASKSTETNGSAALSNQELTLVKGSFCPSVGKLDITTTPLQELWISE